MMAMCEYVEEVLPKPSLVGRSAKARGVSRQWQRSMEERYCLPAVYAHQSWIASNDGADDPLTSSFRAARSSAHYGAGPAPGPWQDLYTRAENGLLWLERVKQAEAKDRGRASECIA